MSLEFAALYTKLNNNVLNPRSLYETKDLWHPAEAAAKRMGKDRFYMVPEVQQNMMIEDIILAGAECLQNFKR